MPAFNNFTGRIATGKALVLSFILFVLFISLVLPHQKAAIAPYTRAAGSPGLRFFPTPDTVYAMADAYGTAGRKAYIEALLIYDFAWPCVYAFFYFVFIRRALGYAHGAGAARLCAIALLPGALDWAENLLTILIFSAYPARIDFVAWSMAAATCLKWLTMGAASVLFAYGLIAAALRFIVARKP